MYEYTNQIILVRIKCILKFGLEENAKFRTKRISAVRERNTAMSEMAEQTNCVFQSYKELPREYKVCWFVAYVEKKNKNMNEHCVKLLLKIVVLLKNYYDELIKSIVYTQYTKNLL